MLYYYIHHMDLLACLCNCSHIINPPAHVEMLEASTIGALTL